MYTMVLIILRTALGTAVSLGLSYLAILLSVLMLDTLLFSFPELEISSWVLSSIWFTFIGLMASIGALVGWIDEDAPRRIDRTLLALTLIGGGCGSWAGMLYSMIVNAGNVYTDHPVSGAALFAASIAANAGATGLAVVRQIRKLPVRDHHGT